MYLNYIIYYLISWSMSHIIWKTNFSSIRIIRSYDLVNHTWLNTFIKQWQNQKLKNGNITPKHSQSMRKHYQWRDVLMKIIRFLVWFCHCLLSPHPHSRRIKEHFARPHHLTPPISGKIYPLSRCLLTTLYKKHPFPGRSRENFPKQITKSIPFPKIIKTHMRTSCSLGVQNHLLMSEIEYIRLMYSKSIAKIYTIFLGFLGEIKNLTLFLALDLVKSPQLYDVFRTEEARMNY